MRGFVSSPDSHFRRLVRHVLNTGTTGQFDLLAYKFSTTVESVARLSEAEILDPGFYNGADTPLSGLLDRIAGQPRRVAVIVSDMVLSGKHANSLDLVKALQRLAAQRRELRLLGFRSSFSGEYYTESGARQTIRLNLSQNLPGTGRPFYLFVVAPNRESLDGVQKYMLEGAGAPQSFSPTDSPLETRDSEFDPESRRESVWNQKADTEKTVEPSGVSLHFSCFLQVKRPGGGESPLRVRFQTVTRVPVGNPANLGITVRKSSFTRGEFSAPAECSLPVKVNFPDKSGNMFVSYTMPHPASTAAWDVYQVRVRGGDGNLLPPLWMQEWNTEDDVRPSNGNRTYQLALLAEAMVRAISEQIVFTEHYVVVGRRK